MTYFMCQNAWHAWTYERVGEGEYLSSKESLHGRALKFIEVSAGVKQLVSFVQR